MLHRSNSWTLKNLQNLNTCKKAKMSPWNLAQNILKMKPQRETLTDLTYFFHAGVSLPQAGNQEANHNKAEDQQSRHDQTQQRHVTRTVANVRGRRGGHGCRVRQVNDLRWHLQDLYCFSNITSSSLFPQSSSVTKANKVPIFLSDLFLLRTHNKSFIFIYIQ